MLFVLRIYSNNYLQMPTFVTIPTLTTDNNNNRIHWWFNKK